MELEHWRVWKCTLGCASRTFPTAGDFRNHIHTSHPRSITTTVNLETITNLGSSIDPGKAQGECPLCVTYRTRSCSDYASHVGHHLEQLALFTIPNVAYDCDTDEESDEQESEQGVWPASELDDYVRGGSGDDASAIMDATRAASSDEEDFTIRVKGTTVHKYRGDEIECPEGTEIHIESTGATETRTAGGDESMSRRGRMAPELPPPPPKLNDYFVPGEGIVREVIEADISRYLGYARVRQGTYEVNVLHHMIPIYC